MVNYSVCAGGGGGCLQNGRWSIKSTVLHTVGRRAEKVLTMLKGVHKSFWSNLDVRHFIFLKNSTLTVVGNYSSQLTSSGHFDVYISIKGRFHEQTEIYKINHQCIQISRRVLQTSSHRRMDIGAILADD